MCAGALYWSQISKIVIGASDSHRGFRVMGTKMHPKTKIIYGVMAPESKELIEDFFKEKRKLK
jgi:tRNA(adenine34) deaminase